MNELKQRVSGEWLQAFVKRCAGIPNHDPDHDLSRFNLDGLLLTEEEARSILRAVQACIFNPMDPLEDIRLPRGRGGASFFDHGMKPIDPRAKQAVKPFYEGFVAIAAAADLHLHYGWPVQDLGFETSGNEFDVFVEKAGNIHIAVEAKRSSDELDKLFEGMVRCGLRGRHDEEPKTKNAHRKYKGLVELQPGYFWGVAPGDRRACTVVVDDDKRVGMIPIRDIPHA